MLSNILYILLAIFMLGLIVTAHEFGHYVEAYVNYDSYASIDVSECYSQAMEYLLLGSVEENMSPRELDNLYRLKMVDTLDLYVQQASFAEFEHLVYSVPPEELDADYLNELSLQLAIDYGYYDGESELYYAMSWIDIPHFFEYPFYVISYPVSNDVAMQIYVKKKKAGFMETGLQLVAYLDDNNLI